MSQQLYTKQDLDNEYDRGVNNAEKLWRDSTEALSSIGLLTVNYLSCAICGMCYEMPDNGVPKNTLCPSCYNSPTKDRCGILRHQNHKVSVTQAQADRIKGQVEKLRLQLQGFCDTLMFQAERDGPYTITLTVDEAANIINTVNEIRSLSATGWQKGTLYPLVEFTPNVYKVSAQPPCEQTKCL